MHDAFPTNDEIRRSFVLISPELSKRYGLEGGCTHAQLAKTASDLGFAVGMMPYLCAAFLNDQELQTTQANESSKDWVEINNRAGRIYNDLLETRKPSDNFRESWKGVNGMGA